MHNITEAAPNDLSRVGGG